MEGLKEVATVADKATETNRVISAVQVRETYREKLLALEPRAKITSGMCTTLARGENSSPGFEVPHVAVGVTQFEVAVANYLTKVLQVMIPVQKSPSAFRQLALLPPDI